MKVAIIGGGHMGSALARGLLNAGVAKGDIAVSDAAEKNAQAVKSAELVLIAVKPVVVRDVLGSLKDELEGKTVLSVAAGISVAALKEAGAKEVGRIMPNIPVAEGEGVVGFFAGTIPTQKATLVRQLLSGLGLLVEVKKESELEGLTLIAGCGPGIVASLIEAVGKRAKALGISGDTEALALQTFMGALHYLMTSGMSPKELADSVATKGGVTEAILTSLRENFERDLEKAIEAGKERLRSIK